MTAKTRFDATPKYRLQHARRRLNREGYEYVGCPECDWPIVPSKNGIIRHHTNPDGDQCPFYGPLDETKRTKPLEDPDLLRITPQMWWREQAACRNEDPRIFDRSIGPDVFKAKAICGTCPVAEQCGEWADADAHFVGVAAGRVYNTERQSVDNVSESEA